MKNLIQFVFVMLLSAGSAFAVMVDDPDAVRIKVSTTGTGVYNLKYKIVEPGEVKIQIINDKGRVIHKNKFHANKNFERKYNLQNQPSGEYQFIISHANATHTHRVKYDKSQGIELKQLDGTRLVEFTVSVPGQHLLVNIYDTKGNLLKRESIKTSYEGARRIYNLKECREGESIIEVVNNFEVVKKIQM